MLTRQPVEALTMKLSTRAGLAMLAVALIPTTVVGTVIYDSIDMRHMLDRIRGAATPGDRIYAVSDRGDYLVHSDPGREALLPVSTIRAPLITIGRGILDASLLACLAAIVLAIAFARSLTRPLLQMTTAMQSYARDGRFGFLERIRNGGAIDNRRTVRIDKRGTQVHVALSAVPLSDPLGPPSGASVNLQEITKQTLAQKMFQLAVEACPSGMFVVDSAGKIVLVNGEIERLFEYSRDELIGQSVDILVPARLREQHAALRGKFAAQPETYQLGSGRDLLGRRKSGSEFAVEVGLNPIHTEEGLLVLGVIIDITERKHAQELFQLAVEACPSGMMMVDGNGCIIMANREIERLFGYGRGELVTRPVDILVPEGLRERHRRHREDFATWPETHNMGSGRHLVGLRKDGVELPVEIGLNPIHLGDDELMVLCVVQDISERKRAERLKDEFVATVSHEMRTPLTSIAASLGLLAGQLAIPLPDAAKRLITIAHTNCQRLVRLINDILDIEKIESGQVVFDRKRIEVRSLVSQAIEASRGLAQSHDVRLRLDEASVTVDVAADADRLTQVIVNLLSNAIMFSPGAAEVVVAVAHQNGIVRVSIRDHGPGIPVDFKPRIFDRFAQADAPDARRKGGTGLGLSIVREIVSRLQGEVGFSDAPGGGAIFHVDLPEWDCATGADGETDAEGTRLSSHDAHASRVPQIREAPGKTTGAIHGPAPHTCIMRAGRPVTEEGAG